MKYVSEIKASITAVFAAVSAFLGWFGWLAVLYAGSMVLDYAVGSALACKQGQWSSKAARDGIWHKGGSLIVVIIAGLADFLIGLVINNIPSITLPFTYSVVFCPVVLVWYILTEWGSIIENAGEMGAPVPGFLRRVIDALHDTVEDAGDKILGPKDVDKE